MRKVETKNPGDSGRSHPGQQRNEHSLAGWKYTPKEKRITLENEDFIAHGFFRCAANEVPWVTGFPGDPGEIHHAMWGGRSALPLPRYICAANNNYVAVSTFKRGVDGQYHRRKDCFSAMHVVMVDDVGTKVAFDKLAL